MLCREPPLLASSCASCTDACSCRKRFCISCRTCRHSLGSPSAAPAAALQGPAGRVLDSLAKKSTKGPCRASCAACASLGCCCSSCWMHLPAGLLQQVADDLEAWHRSWRWDQAGVGVGGAGAGAGIGAAVLWRLIRSRALCHLQHLLQQAGLG